MPQTAELFVIDEVFEHPVIAAIGHWDRGATSMYSFHRRAATILPRLTLSLFSREPRFRLFPRPKDNAHMVRCTVVGELDMHAARLQRYAIELN
jgi:hypothetical protein